MTAPNEASGRARRENNSMTEPRGPRLAAFWIRRVESATFSSAARIGRYPGSYRRLYVLNLAFSFMVPTPLELTDIHRHRKDEQRTAGGVQNGHDGVQGDAV